MSDANEQRGRPARGFSPGRMVRLTRKELQETLRDRRTILTLVLMPLFVYPLLGLTFQKFLLSQATALSHAERPEFVLGFETEAAAARFKPLLGEAEIVRQRSAARSGEEPTTFPAFSAFIPKQGTADVAEFVRRGVVDVGIVLPPADRRGRTPVVLIFDPASPTAINARRELDDRLRSLNDAWYRRTLRRAGVDEPPPVAISIEAIETTGGAAMTIATVLPFVLLLMTVTGAVYPAIDLTAGERERGTLEPLVAAPVSRRAILAAKYVAVFTVAVITAGMNLIAMTATAFSLGLDRFLFGSGLNAAAVSQVVALILVMAAFFSAMLLFVTSFARSFKEAQAYLIPLMIVSLAPGIASLMPELQLTLPLAITPLVGIVLLARDLLTGEVHGLLVVACVGSTLLYAAIALMLAARTFGTDAVLYGSEGTWSELLRRPEEARSVPPLKVAGACLAAIVPMFLLLAPLPGRWEGLSVTER
ncbi:MAG: ABC transporter permease subunit, partial [Planctomycetaceae bacterium]